MQGKIVKGIAGFYYVSVAGSGIYACKAKGIFRKMGMKPLVGDNVVFEITHEADREGNITEILPRENELVRPAAANVGQALIFFALENPDPNFMLLDRFLISMDLKGIPSRIVFNKIDGADASSLAEIEAIYRDCGSPVSFVSVHSGEGMDEVRGVLKGQTTLLAGPSGVGKSSFTNAVLGSDHMEVGEISKKLARGKNTTRHAELIRIDEDSFIFDTPGFSFFTALELKKEDLRFSYHEFDPYEGRCRFDGCVHRNEPDCAVKDALAAGKIHPVRYENYTKIYEELKGEEARRYK
ncbi:MAG: ribosome small subunit-dependent GTPase A [Lachnospiraceae bacterium]|nr:ribosome small subunit-dependent GTPase A [Lachnospiraceae bacterium]